MSLVILLYAASLLGNRWIIGMIFGGSYGWAPFRPRHRELFRPRLLWFDERLLYIRVKDRQFHSSHCLLIAFPTAHSYTIATIILISSLHCLCLKTSHHFTSPNFSQNPGFATSHCLSQSYYLNVMSSISNYANPQIIEGQYVDQRKLLMLLKSVYGETQGKNNFRVEVRSIT